MAWKEGLAGGILEVILLLIVCGDVSCQFNPCDSGSHSLIRDRSRLNTAGTQPGTCQPDSSSGDVSDAPSIFGSDTWYRFTGSTGDRLSTCDSGACRGADTYVLTQPDPHPPHGNVEAVDGELCMQNANTSCSSCVGEVTISIKWCDSNPPFYVYQLPEAPSIDPCDVAYCTRNSSYHAVLSDPVIVDRRQALLTTGRFENVHRFAFTCSINYTATDPDTTKFDVTFKFRYPPYGRDEASLTKTTDADNLEVNLYEEELATYFGTLVSCCVQSAGGPEVCSNSYFAGFHISAGTGYSYRKDQFPRTYVYYWRCLTASSLQLKLQLTVPLSCWHYTQRAGNQSCQYQPRIFDSNLINHACPSVITPRDYTSNVDIEPVAVPGRAYYYARIRFHRFLCAVGDVLNGYIIPSFYLIVRGNCRQRTCSSFGDPHLFTFDSAYYHFYDAGTFTMVQAFTPDGLRATEIQARTRRCGSVSCNCGVIAREGNHMIGIDACNGYPKNIRYLDDPAVPRPQISSSGSSFFVIKMPSGVVIRGYAYRYYMSIYVTIPVYFSTYNVSGLCGNANGNRYDDIIPSTGGTQPLAFYQQYLLPYSASFFNPANIVCRTNPVYVSSTGHQRRCGCSADGMSAICNVTAPAITRTTGASCSDVTQNTGRKKRQVSENLISLEELDYPFDTPDPLTDPVADPVWPTPSGLTKENVTLRCQQALSSSSNAAPCGDFMEDAVNDCVFDVGQTDSVAYLNNALQGFTQTCASELAEQEEVNGTDPVLHFDPATVTLISPEVAEVAQMQCPNQCSAHGNCTATGCDCDPGYGDVDCSFNEAQSSTLDTILSGGLCDVIDDDCDSVRVAGSNIPPSDVSCKIEYTRNGVTTIVTTNATIELGDTFACDLPLTLSEIPATHIFLSLSLQAPGRETNSLQMTLYDSTCQECDMIHVCSLKPETCEINNQCYEDADQDPLTPCLFCDASASPFGWTPGYDPLTPTAPVQIYKFPDEDIQQQLVAPSPSHLNVVFALATGSPSGLTLSPTGLLRWSGNSGYSNVVHVRQQPCGYAADIQLDLTVLSCLCQNGGSCISGPGPSGLQFTCTCQTGFTGTLCEDRDQLPTTSNAPTAPTDVIPTDIAPTQSVTPVNLQNVLLAGLLPLAAVLLLVALVLCFMRKRKSKQRWVDDDDFDESVFWRPGRIRGTRNDYWYGSNRAMSTDRYGSRSRYGYYY